MVKVIEAKGETIDAAVKKALLTLGRDRDDVSVEVLAKPKSGFFGFGKEPASVRVSYETSPSDTAKDFLEGLLIRFGVTANIHVTEDSAEKSINIELSGDNMGTVIGRRGDTLDAIQYLTSIIANHEENDRWRITVDTENYRAKREDALKQLAAKTAEKALKYKKGIALDAMNPHERRIIHSALQETPGITTYSTGSEPNRKVIVAPAGEKRLPPPSGNRRPGNRPQGSRPQGSRPQGSRPQGNRPQGNRPQTPRVEKPVEKKD